MHVLVAQDLIQSIISWYFIKDKDRRDLFCYLFFENRNAEFSLNKSIRILEILLNDIFSEFNKENPNIVQDLDNFRKMRNRLSHTLPDPVRDEFELAQKNCLILWFYEKGKVKEHAFDISELERMINDFTKNVLNPLMRLLYLDEKYKKY